MAEAPEKPKDQGPGDSEAETRSEVELGPAAVTEVPSTQPLNPSCP